MVTSPCIFQLMNNTDIGFIDIPVTSHFQQLFSGDYPAPNSRAGFQNGEGEKEGYYPPAP